VSQLSQVSQGGCASFKSELSPSAADDALERNEERAAIREYDGGRVRGEAEAAALVEASRAAGVAPEALRQSWAQHPDAVAYLALLHREGPQTFGSMASALGWGATRAWQAEARLRAAGLVRLGVLGRAELVQSVAYVIV
jgi:hypothetical protein